MLEEHVLNEQLSLPCTDGELPTWKDQPSWPLDGGHVDGPGCGHSGQAALHRQQRHLWGAVKTRSSESWLCHPLLLQEARLTKTQSWTQVHISPKPRLIWGERLRMRVDFWQPLPSRAGYVCYWDHSCSPALHTGVTLVFSILNKYTQLPDLAVNSQGSVWYELGVLLVDDKKKIAPRVLNLEKWRRIKSKPRSSYLTLCFTHKAPENSF